MCGQSQGASSGMEREVVQDQVVIIGGNPYYQAINIYIEYVQRSGNRSPFKKQAKRGWGPLDPVPTFVCL